MKGSRYDSSIAKIQANVGFVLNSREREIRRMALKRFHIEPKNSNWPERCFFDLVHSIEAVQSP